MDRLEAGLALVLAADYVESAAFEDVDGEVEAVLAQSGDGRHRHALGSTQLAVLGHSAVAVSD